MNADRADVAGYAVEDGDLVRDRDAAVSVWQASLGKAEGRAAKFDWFYRAAPDGALLQVLRAGPERNIVGTAGVGWRRMRIGARRLRGGLLADMAVLAGHRVLGPALQLQRAACEQALAAGDLVYGFPNANSVPVVKRLGYTKVGDMALHVRALRHAPYLERRLPRPVARLLGWGIDRAVGLRDRLRNLGIGRVRIEWRDSPYPGRHVRLAARVDMLEGERDHASLDWRFARNPMASFRFLYLRSGTDAPPPAWLVCHRDGDTMRIADIGFEHATAAAQCLAALAEAATGEGCRSLAIECCLPGEELAALAAAGFRQRQHHPIYARWKDPGESVPTIRITAFDEDE